MSQDQPEEIEEGCRSLLNSAADGILLCDLQARTVYLNSTFTRMFGWSIEELKGKPIPFVPETEKTAAKALWKGLVEEGTPCQGVETRRKTKSGQMLDVSFSASRYPDHRGHPAGVLVVLRDVSSRVKLERQLRQAVKLEALGTLAGGVAHDFNNLMMGMLGNLSLLLMEVGPDHPSFERLKKIEALIHTGSRSTNQLLGYARQGKFELIPIPLNPLIVQAVENFGRTRKQVTIRVDLAGDLFQIEADPGQIEQVIMNLCTNAADAMPDGGSLSIKTRNVTHEDFGNDAYRPAAGAYVLIRLSDTGAGMDEKTAKRIFDPFFTTKEMGRGIGLGLASVYGIVKGHGGYIDVASEIGKGTAFSVYLPAPGRKKAASPETEKPILSGQETILLVDDEEIILEVGAQILDALGYDVMTAAGGREAVALYKRNRDGIDMVILDMIMPDLGGGDVYDEIRRMDARGKVLLSSGYGIDGQAREILDRGCNGFIQKPFNIEELSRKIREILNEKTTAE